MWKQLKRVSIPVFSGDVEVYENWKAAFLVCIDVAPATPEYKLLQLRQYLSDEALMVIENLGHSAKAYQSAKDRLERKYGDKRRHIALQFEELHKFKPIMAGNAKDVEHFADLLDVTIINLKNYGLYNELDSKLLYLVLCKKMTDSMVTQYQRWVTENGKEELIELLRKRIIKEAEYRIVTHEAIRGLSDLVVNSRFDNKSGWRSRAFVTTDSKYQKRAYVAAELGLQGKCEKTEAEVINSLGEVFETTPVDVGLESLDRQVDIMIAATTIKQGVSLNDEINQGRKMQKDPFDMLFRFRKNPVVVVCDIEEMYLQIQLSPQDGPYHRFLWRNLDQTATPRVRMQQSRFRG
ncbi:hypothetical protein HOLleu_03974 [Holothuria leucospilota]|uniref:Uncharacterized protein n=1 Tax=Holothuria leucospilota TaxID=206669 RepID=A0A9Q1CSB4_HOLLE|nr:hypothetical protein HOLleu_03974 [Holothuria leucospilota]